MLFLRVDDENLIHLLNNVIDDNNSKWQPSCLAIGNELMLVFAL